MSIVSSYFSSRPPNSGANVRHPAIMDSIFAIVAGLGLRLIIDYVSRQDNKVTGTLVGLWEGVVMQHFLNKMPKSYDPYVAYGLRLFIDLLFTESLRRLILVLIWTGMGIILADVTPAIWVDVGLRRFWRRFRRDLYIIQRSIPSVPLFSRPRIVRFTPPGTGSVVSAVDPTILSSANVTPPTVNRLVVPTPAVRKRPVPGAFPETASEAETEITSPRSPISDSSTSLGTTHYRFSLFQRRRRTNVETVSEGSSTSNDLDDGYISSSESSQPYSVGTSLTHPAEIPDEEEETETEREVVRVDKGKGRELELDLTPVRTFVVLPPTPSDSAFAYNAIRGEPQEVPKPGNDVPLIPDFYDGWENISKTELTPTPTPEAHVDKPPTPPAKDPPFTSTASSPPHQVPPPIQIQRSMPAEQDVVSSNRATLSPVKNTLPDANLLDIDSTALSPGDSDPPASVDLKIGSMFRSSSLLEPPPSYEADQRAINLDRLSSEPQNSIQYAPVHNTTDGKAADETRANNGSGHNTHGQENVPNADATIDATNTNTDSQHVETQIVDDQQATKQQASEQVDNPSSNELPSSSDPPVEPLQEGRDRLTQVLELRRQATKLEEEILSIQMEGSGEVVMKEEDLGRLNRKADAWYEAAYEGLPLTQVDTSGLNEQQIYDKIEDALVQSLLKNQPFVSVTYTKSRARASKAALISLLKGPELVYKDSGKTFTIDLPTTPRA